MGFLVCIMLQDHSPQPSLVSIYRSVPSRKTEEKEKEKKKKQESSFQTLQERNRHGGCSRWTSLNRANLAPSEIDSEFGLDSFLRKKMKSEGSYVPPPYIPLGQSDTEAAKTVPGNGDSHVVVHRESDGPVQWSSGICACCDDMQSCCIGLFCPCYLFGKNAEFLGSGTLFGSCMTHCILWGVMNTVCCLMTEGIMLGLPGCFVSCYASGYRKALREKYNLPEGPCSDLVTHFCCHPCANCQEYREIRERSGDAHSPDLNLAVVTAPSVQTMESGVTE